MAEEHPRFKEYFAYALAVRGIQPTDRQARQLRNVLFAKFHTLAQQKQDDLGRLVSRYQETVEAVKAVEQIMSNHPAHLEYTSMKPNVNVLESILSPYNRKIAALSAHHALIQRMIAFERGYAANAVEHLERRLGEVDDILKKDKANQADFRAKVQTLRSRAEQERDFLKIKPRVLQGDWRGKFRFGGGANTSGLWAKYDQHGNVIDQIVRKSQICSNTSWPFQFHNQVPKEAYYANQCAELSTQHFVPVSDFETDPAKRMVTVYSPYCKYGDLWDLTKQHLTSKEPVPEPLLWYIFLHLTEACIYMRDGANRGEGVRDWNHIIHRDIKPPNIFLDLPSQRFPAYPTPKLGDFGLAISTFINDPDNPSAYNSGSGTAPYRPPEQLNVKARTAKASTFPDRELVDLRLWEWTNIYSVGLCIFQLINRKVLDREEQKYFVREDESWAFHKTARPYSMQLKGWVNKCIQVDPQKRVGLDQLYAGLSQMEPGGMPEMAQYLKEAMDGRQSMTGEYQVRYGVKAEYANIFAHNPPA